MNCRVFLRFFNDYYVFFKGLVMNKQQTIPPKKYRVVSTSSARTSQEAEVSIEKHGPIGNEEEKCPWASFQGTDATVLRPQCLSCPRERKEPARFQKIRILRDFLRTQDLSDPYSQLLLFSATLILSYSYSHLLLVSATLSLSYSYFQLLCSQLLYCVGKQKFLYGKFSN